MTTPLHPRRGKRIAILQSNYVPWKGYFDLLDHVDEFILLDSVQYTRSDWRNRNRIVTPHGERWLTIPIETAGRLGRRIKDARTSHDRWPAHHWKQLQFAYAQAPAFRELRDWLGHLFSSTPTRWLTEINEHFLRAIQLHLGIETTILRDDAFDHAGAQDRSLRLVEICKQAGAAEYVSGPAARVYLDEEVFRRNEIAVTWFEYPEYPVYEQRLSPFTHAVSVLDVLLNTGADAPAYIFRTRADPTTP